MSHEDVPASPRNASQSGLTKGALLASRYEILDYIGKGGMGLVYKAHDRLLDDVVAIKVLRPQLLDNDVMRQRFLSEIKLARRVTHRNVCRIHDYGEDGALSYISMQFVDGVELKTMVQKPPGLTVDEAYEIAIQLSDGLQAIHDEGIVHRDLKSANVMVDARGAPRLMDFGIAKLWESEPGAGLTLDGHITGTPEYMSPEQASNESLDPRSDLYSMGIVLFELFTGTRPFTASNLPSVMYMQIHEAPPLDAPVAADIPAALKPIIAKALAKRREDRYSTASELRRGLLEARSAGAPSNTQTTETIVARVQHLRGGLDATQPASKSAGTAESKPQLRAGTGARDLRRLLIAASLVFAAAIVASNLVRWTADESEPSKPAQQTTPADRPTTASQTPGAAPSADPIERKPTVAASPHAGAGASASTPTPTATSPDASLTRSCERGDAGACLEACDDEHVAAACTQLGVLYNQGAGVSRDFGAAALYYERGCSGGDLAGCNNLGTLYQFGVLGLRADRLKAGALYERACTGGRLDACANLGSLYLEEPGASAQQKARARGLLEKACAGGISRACDKIRR